MDHYDLSAVILIVLSLGVIIAYMTYEMFNIKLHGAITLGISISYILLNVMYPIGVLMYERRSFVITLYIIIELLMPLYLFLYLFFLIMTSHRR